MKNEKKVKAEEPQPDKCPVDLLVIFKLRELVSKREQLVSSANNDIAKYGEWQCDWSIGFNEIDKRIAELRVI